MSGYQFEKVINSNMCLQVFDHDRFSKDDIIGEVIMPMLPSDLINGQTMWKDIQHSERHTVRSVYSVCQKSDPPFWYLSFRPLLDALYLQFLFTYYISFSLNA